MGGDTGSVLRAEVRRILGEQTPEEQLDTMNSAS